jgi:3-hydroxyisobutyrate dehydrogenase
MFKDSTDMRKRIAVLGVGIMGEGIVLNLKKGHHELHLYSRSIEKIKYLQEESTFVHSLALESVKNADIVIVCLTEDSVLKNILYKERVLDEIPRTLVDFGTTSLELTLSLHQDCQKRGLRFFDSPMTGSKLAARAGEIVFMMGGSDEDYETLKPVYDLCSKKVIRCGKVGDGQIAKICLNMVQAGILQIYMEGLMLSQKSGLPSDVYYEVIQNSAAFSPIASTKLGAIFNKDFSTNFALKNMNKDINHALRLALEKRATLPMSFSLKSIYDAGMNHNLSETDFCSLIEINRMLNQG